MTMDTEQAVGGEVPERWSAKAKGEVVLRLFRGDAVEVVSREVQVPAHEIESWRRAFLEAGQAHFIGDLLEHPTNVTDCWECRKGEGWTVDEYTLNFRIGGIEFSRFRFMDGLEIRNYTLFEDVVPDRRIVFAYRMTVGPKPISVSLGTVQLLPSGEGTLMTYTEQGVYFGDPDAVKGREQGSRGLLERLAAELEGAL